MKLLTLDNSDSMMRAKPTPEARNVVIFEEIIRRDRGSPGDASARHKLRATRELAYIYHMANFTSPYSKYPPAERSAELIKDIFPPEEQWSPDALVISGVEYYQKMHLTPSMKLLSAARQAVSKLEKYLRNVEFDSVTGSGKLKYDPKDLIANLDKLPKVVQGLKDLEEQVRKEQSEGSETWGGIKVNKYSQG